MQPHYDDADLLRLATGETDGLDGAHLDACPDCADRRSMLRRLLDAATVDPIQPLDPPTGLWDRIAAQVDVKPADPADHPFRAGSRDGGHRHLRRWSNLALAVAVAAALLVGILAGGLLRGLRTTPPEATVAATQMQPVEGAGSGTARIVDRNGTLVLHLDAKGLATPAHTYHQAWLLAPDGVRMIPIGTLAHERAELPLPPGVDLRTYPVLDVSVQQLNGNPAHSGHSLLRGRLEATP